MSGLRDHLESVSADSLAATGDDHLIETETPVEKPAPDAPAAPTEKPAGEGRTIDNVHGELSRKQVQFEQRVMERLDRFSERITSRQPETQQPKTKVEDYSVAELSAYLNGLPADNPQRSQIESVIADKIVNEKVEKQVRDITGRQQLKVARQDAIKVAIERYPELRNEASEFWVQVDKELRFRGDSYATSNPSAVLDVANEVAQRMGIQAKRNIRTVARVPDRPANRRDGAAPVQGDEQYLMSEEQALKIAGKLEAALGRKYTPEEIKKIRENHASYKSAQNLFVRG